MGSTEDCKVEALRAVAGRALEAALVIHVGGGARHARAPALET